ncbi:MAG: flavin reductase, partial [Clostridia bacterium]|nr:flavin reductase [Clostridia bacterium]
RVAVTINKDTYSHEIIKQTGKMNVNCLTEDAPFSLFQNFGFKSGRDTDKFKNVTSWRAENGVMVLTDYINAYISLEVESYVDLDTHGMFICSVTNAYTITDKNTMTYTYYFKNVKPKPETKKKGYICKICGYVYEGEPLPDDFVCPICKHGASDFEPIK